MSRPKRSAVASDAPSARVTSFAAMSQSTDNSARDPQSRQRRGKARSVQELRIQTQPNNAKQHSKSSKEVVDSAAADTSAIQRLKRRRGEQPTRKSPSVSGRHRSDASRLSSASSASNTREDKHLSKDASGSRQQPALSPIVQVGPMHAPRDGTPDGVSNESSDDLYGLSPQGKKSQMELQHTLEAKRLSLTQRQVPSSVLRPQRTPGHETSILALKNFKRRTRQPSILRTGHRQSVQSALHLDSDLDDFNPDDESTPFKVGRAPSDEMIEDHVPRSSSSRKRKFSELAVDVDLPRSSPPLDEDINEAVELMKDTINLTRNNSTSLASEASDLPEQVAKVTTEAEAAQPEDWSDTMAPPRSSSSLVEDLDMPSVTHPSQQKRRSGGKPSRPDQAMEEKKTRSKAKPGRAPTLSTAALQDLLPQRRNRRGRKAKPDTFDIPSDDDADELVVDSSEDNLTRPPSRGRGNGRGSRARSTLHAIPAKAASNNKKGRFELLSPQKAASRPAKKHTGRRATGASAKKTYGRQSNVSDKENDESLFDPATDDVTEDHITLDGPRAQPVNSAELEAAARKFAEVDEWEMDFESVDASAEGSSWR